MISFGRFQLLKTDHFVNRRQTSRFKKERSNPEINFKIIIIAQLHV